jgi:menaquinone-dependent protoporphyrinogen oxidase
MKDSILVAYATRYGSTQEVAKAIVETLCSSGLAVEIKLAREVRNLDGYRAVVLGAPLFMFHWHKDAHQFLTRHRKVLEERPVAVFALGPVHEPHNPQEWQNSRDQLDKELAKYPWFAPFSIEMFGGKFHPAYLRFPLNLMAGKEPASDIRDWEAIRAWAGSLAGKLSPEIHS